MQRGSGKVQRPVYQTRGYDLSRSYQVSIWFMQLAFLLAAACWGATIQAQENKMNNQQEQQILQQPEKIPALVAAGKISVKQVPNPHWRKDACLACHSKKPDKQGLHLRNRDVDRVCNNCHSVISDHSYIHPSGMKPGTKIKKRMSKQFRSSLKRTKGKVGCITCHDLRKQCIAKKFEQKRLNPKFFSGGPYRERSAICYKCHDGRKYERLNPHDQVTKQGILNQERCGVCHHSLDGLADARRIEDVDFNMADDLSRMCTGCHPWKPHPGGSFSFGKKKKTASNHLIKLPAEMQQHYDRQQADSETLLPLEPGTGKVFCATCHNPHAKGVIKNSAAAKGADSKQRLRMTELCVQCHDK